MQADCMVLCEQVMVQEELVEALSDLCMCWGQMGRSHRWATGRSVDCCSWLPRWALTTGRLVRSVRSCARSLSPPSASACPPSPPSRAPGNPPRLHPSFTNLRVPSFWCATQCSAACFILWALFSFPECGQNSPSHHSSGLNFDKGWI